MCVCVCGCGAEKGPGRELYSGNTSAWGAEEEEEGRGVFWVGLAGWGKGAIAFFFLVCLFVGIGRGENRK